MKKIVLLFGLIFTLLATNAQNSDILTRVKNKSDKGEIEIIQDERIDYLFRRYNRYRRYTPIKGYRVRIFSDSGKHAEGRARNYIGVFRTEFPYDEYHASAYIEWDLPNFKVYVGDFRTKTEALKFQKIIAKEFPYGFYVYRNINLPVLK